MKVKTQIYQHKSLISATNYDVDDDDEVHAEETETKQTTSHISCSKLSFCVIDRRWVVCAPLHHCPLSLAISLSLSMSLSLSA